MSVGSSILGAGRRQFPGGGVPDKHGTGSRGGLADCREDLGITAGREPSLNLS